MKRFLLKLLLVVCAVGALGAAGAGSLAMIDPYATKFVTSSIRHDADSAVTFFDQVSNSYAGFTSDVALGFGYMGSDAWDGVVASVGLLDQYAHGDFAPPQSYALTTHIHSVIHPRGEALAESNPITAMKESNIGRPNARQVLGTTTSASTQTSASLSLATVKNLIQGTFNQMLAQGLLTGPQGPQGPGGAAGTSGAQGIQGPQGGAVYNPITYYPANPPANSNGGSIGAFTNLSSSNFVTDSFVVNNNSTIKGSESISGSLNVTGTITGSVAGSINPGFTAGSVIFQGASGLAQDNANFFYDETNHRLGVGTTSPQQQLHVSGNIRVATPGATTYTDIIPSGTTSTILDFDTIPGDATSAATVRLFRHTNTTGVVSLQILRGDATSGAAIQLAGNGNSWINPTNSGLLGIGTISPTGKLHIAGNISASSWTTAGIELQAAAATYTDTSGSGTIATRVGSSFAQPTFASSSAVTLTDAATLYIANAPAPGTNTTITRGHALQVAAGDAVFAGNVGIGTTAPASLFSVGSTNLFQVNNSGQTGIGVAPSSSALLNVGGTHPGAGSQIYGIISGFVSPSTATAESNSVYAYTRTAASAFALIAGHAFRAQSPTVGAGSSIGTQYGLKVEAQKITGVTTGYGVYQVGASDLNYFAGNVGIGITAPSQSLTVGASSTEYFQVRTTNAATGWNAADATLYVGRDATTSRSINAAGSVNASGADYAEYFAANSGEGLVAGEVACLASAGQVRRCPIDGSAQAVGVVSTQPAFVGNDTGSFEGTSPVLIGLAGQVPVKVTSENGSVQVGDYLTISATQPGRAMKATNPGWVIGKVLAVNGQTIMLIQSSYYVPSVATMLQDGNSGNTQLQTDLATLNITDASAFGDLVVVGQVYIQKDLTVKGTVTAATIIGDTITAKEKLCINTTCVTEEQLRALLNQLPSSGNSNPGNIGRNPTPPPPSESSPDGEGNPSDSPSPDPETQGADDSPPTSAD